MQTEDGRETGQIKNKPTQDSPVSNKHISGTKADKSKANQHENTICTVGDSEKSLLRFEQQGKNVINEKSKLKDNTSGIQEEFPSTRNILKQNIESKVSLNQKSIAVEKWVENQNKYLDKGNPFMIPFSNIIPGVVISLSYSVYTNLKYQLFLVDSPTCQDDETCTEPKEINPEFKEISLPNNLISNTAFSEDNFR